MKTYHLSLILFTLLFFSSCTVAQDFPQPYPIYGLIKNTDGAIPQNPSITLLNTRTKESIDQSTLGCFYDNSEGIFSLEAGNFPSGYMQGDEMVLTITASGKTHSHDFSLSGVSPLFLGELVLSAKSQPPAIQKTTISSAIVTTSSQPPATSLMKVSTTVDLLPSTSIQSDSGRVCVQVVTPAVDSDSGECREFPTPCDVPSGWVQVAVCPSESVVVIDEGGEVVSTVVPSTEPSCRDGVRNQGEEGVDCGGPCRKPCPESGLFSESGLYGIAMVLGLLLVVVVAVIAYLSFSSRK